MTRYCRLFLILSPLVAGQITTPIAAAAPLIVVQPQNQAVAAGSSNVTFSVVATDSLPLSYQWQFDGINLPRGTGASLEVRPATVGKAGVYSVSVSDSSATTNSNQAYLDVYTNRTGHQSEEFALEHLRTQMDLYHDRVAVYDDTVAAAAVTADSVKTS